ESGTSHKTSACDVLLLWLISASTRICANPVVKFTVHLLPTASSSEQLNRVHPRRIAQKKTTSQFTSSCFGLAHGSGKWHKEQENRILLGIQPLRSVKGDFLRLGAPPGAISLLQLPRFHNDVQFGALKLASSMG